MILESPALCAHSMYENRRTVTYVRRRNTSQIGLSRTSPKQGSLCQTRSPSTASRIQSLTPFGNSLQMCPHLSREDWPLEGRCCRSTTTSYQLRFRPTRLMILSCLRPGRMLRCKSRKVLLSRASTGNKLSQVMPISRHTNQHSTKQ